MRIITCNLKNRFVSPELAELIKLANSLYNKLIAECGVGSEDSLSPFSYPEISYLCEDTVNAIWTEAMFSKRLGPDVVERINRGSVVFNVTPSEIQLDSKNRPYILKDFKRGYISYYRSRFGYCEKALKIPIMLGENYSTELITGVRICARMNMKDWKAIYSLKEPEYIKPLAQLHQSYAGLDIGLNNLVAVVCGNGNYRLVSGKYADDLNRSFYCSVGKLASSQLMSDESVEIKVKYDNKLHNYLNNVVGYLYEFILSNDVTTLVIGDSGFKNYNGLKKSHVKKKIKTLPTDLLVLKIKNKFKDSGVALSFVEESYTSLASFFDGDTIPEYSGVKSWYKFSGRRVEGKYYMASGLCLPADINASLNIIRKVNKDFNVDFRKLNGREVKVSELFCTSNRSIL